MMATMIPELMDLVTEIMGALAILLKALVWGISGHPMEAHGQTHVREGLLEIRKLVHVATANIRAYTGQCPDHSGGSGASGSQGPCLPPAMQAVMAIATPEPIITTGAAGMVPQPAFMEPLGPRVFITMANFTSKGGKYHDTSDCHGLANALSAINDYDLNMLLQVPRHKFELCLVCKNSRVN